MKKSEFKKLLKPIVKECVRESLFEGGLLSGIIAEVVSGLGEDRIVESRKPPVKKSPPVKDAEPTKEAPTVNQRLAEHRKSLMSAIGSDAYGGIDLFEGTTPAPAAGSGGAASSPLGGIDPGDAGIDISGIMSVGGSKWKSLI